MATAPVPLPVHAPRVHGVAMAQMVEGRNAEADHDHHTAPDMLTGLWVINDTRLSHQILLKMSSDLITLMKIVKSFHRIAECGYTLRNPM